MYGPEAGETAPWVECHSFGTDLTVMTRNDRYTQRTAGVGRATHSDGDTPAARKSAWETYEPGMVGHACHPGAWKVVAGRSGVRGQLQLPFKEVYTSLGFKK